MQWAECCLLLLPSGRSAHLEAGYFVGAGKHLSILITMYDVPELMYKMADGVYNYINPILVEYKRLDNEKRRTENL